MYPDKTHQFVEKASSLCCAAQQYNMQNKKSLSNSEPQILNPSAPPLSSTCDRAWHDCLRNCLHGDEGATNYSGRLVHRIQQGINTTTPIQDIQLARFLWADAAFMHPRASILLGLSPNPRVPPQWRGSARGRRQSLLSGALPSQATWMVRGT